MSESRQICPGRGRDLACVLMLAAASAILFAPAFRPGFEFVGVSSSLVPPWNTTEPPRGPQDAAGSDSLIFTWPNLHHWRESVRHDWSGLLWNPGIFCGAPFLAMQATFPLYPSNLLSLAGDLPTFLLWTSFLHVALANVGAYFALRRLRLARPACLFGAWAFGAGSWFLAHLDVVNFPQAAAWLPWILYAADRAQVERRTRDRLMLSACTALSILAGMIQITMITLLLCAVMVRLRAEAQARLEGRRAWRGVVSALAGIAIGILLAGPQLVPLIEWSRDSSRVRTSAEDLQRFAYRPLEWASLVIPEILGSPAEISRWTELRESGNPASALLPPMPEASYPPAALAGARGRGATFLESVCSPLSIGLMLGLVSLTRLRRTTAIFLTVVALGAFLAMDTPLARAFASAPMAAFANPRRVLLLSAVGFAGLAALGAHTLWTAGRRHGVALLPAGVLACWLILNHFFSGFVGERLAAATGNPTAARVPGIFVLQGLWPALVFSVGGALLVVPGHVRWRAAGLGLLAFADAFFFNVRNNPTRPVEPIFPEVEVTKFVAERVRDPLPPTKSVPVHYDDPRGPLCRIARVRGALPGVPAPIPPNVGALFGLHDQQGYGGILPRALEELLEVLEPGIVFEHLTVGEWPDATAFARPAVDLLGVGYVVSSHHELPHLYTVRQFPAETCSVFGNPGFVPRVTAVTRGRVFETAPDLIRAMTGETFDPATEAFLLRSDLDGLGLPEPDARGTIELSPPAPGETVRWSQQGCGAAEVEAMLAAPRLLVVTESYHPGWRAKDETGRRIPLSRVNHAFQVLALPAGHTRVRVTFAPGSLDLGVAAAALGVLLLLADGMLRRRAASGHENRHVQ